jgi:hypothetical protein
MSKLNRLSIILFALAGSAVAAQQPPPSDDSAIVVTGEKISKDDISAFVKGLTKVGSNGQLSRFEHEVCPMALGLGSEQRQIVENRIRAVANAVDIAVGKAKCSPNILLIVAGDKRAVMEELWRHHSYVYGDVSGKHIRDLIRSPDQVAAWQIDGPPMADGKDVPTDLMSGVPINRTTTRGSRLTAAAYPQFAAAVVIVSRDALVGLTTIQLADYAAMRTLTGADPARLAGSGPTSILRVMAAPEGSEVPITMTEWDLAFLRGYYDARRNLTAAAQRSSITEGMTKVPDRKK